MGREAVNKHPEAYTGNVGRLETAKVLVCPYCDYCWYDTEWNS